MQALQAFPKVDTIITSPDGKRGTVRKIDIFKKRIWVHYPDGAWADLDLDTLTAGAQNLAGEEAASE